MKKKNPHAVALGRLGGLNSGGHREGAGRPRKTDVPRCACGAMTLAHALAVPSMRRNSDRTGVESAFI